MAMKLISALTLLAVASAAPLADIRSALFCTSWSPLGTDYAADESPYDYFCSGSEDGQSLTMRVIAPESDDAYSYLAMSAVDLSGNAMVGGEYKLDARLRSLTCDDKSKRILKIEDDKVNDIIVTYHLPEDKEITLDQVNCRFAVAKSLDTYYRDVTVNRFGDEVTEFAETSAPLDTSVPLTNETNEFEVVEPEINLEGDADEAGEIPIITVENPILSENETAPVVEIVPEVVATTTTTTEAPEPVDETFETVDEFHVTNTIDETDDLQNKFNQEETIGKEIGATNSPNETLAIGAPEAVPEIPDEQRNEGESVEEEAEQEFIIDEFGVMRVVIPEKEKKLSYKGTQTGYWCEEMGNTYMMAPGTDCQMFYQTVMKDDRDSEVIPLAHFNCAPGTRFNTFKCTCSSYGGMVCPDPNPEFKTTTLAPQTFDPNTGVDPSNITTPFPSVDNNGTQF